MNDLKMCINLNKPAGHPPTYTEMVLQGLGYNPNDYELIEYIYDYSEGKTNWYGDPIPKIDKLKFRNINSNEIYMIRLKEEGGFECESISKE